MEGQKRISLKGVRKTFAPRFVQLILIYHLIILDFLICIHCQLPDVFLSENVAKDRLLIGQQIFLGPYFERQNIYLDYLSNFAKQVLNAFIHDLCIKHYCLLP